MKNTYAVCYNNLYVFKNKKDAINFFLECSLFCDRNSSECSRYTNIVIDLQSGNNVGKDYVEDDVYEIVYKDKNKREKIEWQNYRDAIKKVESEV